MIKRILHVDDDPDIREIILFSLESVGGFEVLSCESGAEALQMSGEFVPDLFLLDLMMPEMDGEQLFCILGEQDATRNTPVIFITALKSNDTHARLRALGAIEVFDKPFDPLELPRMILDAVKSSSL